MLLSEQDLINFILYNFSYNFFFKSQCCQPLVLICLFVSVFAGLFLLLFVFVCCCFVTINYSWCFVQNYWSVTSRVSEGPVAQAYGIYGKWCWRMGRQWRLSVPMTCVRVDVFWLDYIWPARPSEPVSEQVRKSTKHLLELYFSVLFCPSILCINLNPQFAKKTT